MSQGVIPLPAGGDGATVRAAINAALARVQTKASGTARPSDIGTYEDWVDTDTPGAGIATWYLWDGTSDIALGTFNTSTHAFTPAGATGGIGIPQGRLTLTSATPVLGANVTSATTIYYALYAGNQIPIYDGASAFVMTPFAELSNATAQSSTGKAGPAAVANNSNYDLFVWSDSGTLRLTRGPLWTSDTARGTGAGTSELQRINGFWTNKVAITNGPGANLGTYVGTVRSNGSAAISMEPILAAASGGSDPILGVWNAYNRRAINAQNRDSANWTYATATWRRLDNSLANRIRYIDGLAESAVKATLQIAVSSPNITEVGLERDWSSGAPGGAVGFKSASTGGIFSTNNWAPSLGLHEIDAVEYASAATQGLVGSGTSGVVAQAAALTVSLEM